MTTADSASSDAGCPLGNIRLATKRTVNGLAHGLVTHLATSCLTHGCRQAWQSEAWGTLPARLRR